jgi:phenylacetate-CoA ligase
VKTIHQLNELITFARQHSDYYNKTLNDVNEPITALAQLPLTDPVEYWNHSHDLDHWPVLTSSPSQALVFKTGGSTSAGKLSVYSRSEWQALVRDFGRSLTTQFQPGDRVANLFFAGDLYASFLFIHDALAHVAALITEFPFTGDVDSRVLAEAIVQHRINVLAGVPAHLLTFAAWLHRHGQVLDGVETILFGGESLFASQRQMLAQVFPNARITSIGYASVDAGFIGASTLDCDDGEHRMQDEHAIIEIIDEVSGAVIDDCDQPGLLLLTNLSRTLMPLIRYPVGDRACWREPAGTAGRKFVLKGRSASSQRVRVGILSLIPSEIGAIVEQTVGSDDWQLVIEQTEHKDVLSLKWRPTSPSPSTETANRQLESRLMERYPLIEKLQADHLLELRIQRCTTEALHRHPRSGKCLRVLDLRVYASSAKELA